MVYQSEAEMYPEVQNWLRSFLSNRFRQAKVEVYDTSKKVLSRFLIQNKLHIFFQDYPTYEIEVDVLGVIRDDRTATLAFVECKLKKVTLRDLSQLLGYSKVAKPLISIILSPEGVSDSLHYLFNVHRRDDVLYYDRNRFVHITKWLQARQDIDYSSIIPKGSSL